MIDVELLKVVLRGQIRDSWHVLLLVVLFSLMVFASTLAKKPVGKLPKKYVDWGLLISALWAIQATQENKQIFFWGHNILTEKGLWAEGYASLCTLMIGFVVVALDLFATCHNLKLKTGDSSANGIWFGLIWKRLILLALVIADTGLILLSSGWLLILGRDWN